MPRHQDGKGVFAAVAHLRHESEVVGFWLDGIGHEKAFLDPTRKKGKSFATGDAPGVFARKKE